MKQASTRATPFPAGRGIFLRMFTRLGCLGRPPRFHVEYFPYANITHTIRIVEDTALVRLSDVFRDAPLPVLEATAAILLARLHRRRVSREIQRAYREFSLAPATRRQLLRLRRTRGRRVKRAPRGTHHDLRKLFAHLNRDYFHGRLPRPRLGWSAWPWRTQLGCFDPALNQIVLSSRLDQPDVPPFAVEYVLFHEMLHVKHPVRRASCGLQAHSAEFRRQEKRFQMYDRARRFLEHLS